MNFPVHKLSALRKGLSPKLEIAEGRRLKFRFLESRFPSSSNFYSSRNLTFEEQQGGGRKNKIEFPD